MPFPKQEDGLGRLVTQVLQAHQTVADQGVVTESIQDRQGQEAPRLLFLRGRRSGSVNDRQWMAMDPAADKSGQGQSEKEAQPQAATSQLYDAFRPVLEGIHDA